MGATSDGVVFHVDELGGRPRVHIDVTGSKHQNCWVTQMGAWSGPRHFELVRVVKGLINAGDKDVK